MPGQQGTENQGGAPREPSQPPATTAPAPTHAPAFAPTPAPPPPRPTEIPDFVIGTPNDPATDLYIFTLPVGNARMAPRGGHQRSDSRGHRPLGRIILREEGGRG
ncbi:hypothetical protein FA15DRAFT_702136 [Coprinopsis marcescibilis]|uniref:Uncharacterized protein n=1 Tax=Coprinopsis marcescibilis TaxID=230819 RepID=A0A5C3L363_COPMA|nr:hypothetical protein FA15DRAFT_702136 [Coprinopsis marcescibilis]